MTADEFVDRLLAVRAYAQENGFTHGWPNFEQADYGEGRGLVYGCYFTRAPQSQTFIEWLQIADLAIESSYPYDRFWRATNRWAYYNGYATATPIWGFWNEEWPRFRPVVQVWASGLDYLKAEEAPLRELDGQPPFEDPEGCVRAANRWAIGRGYAAGFPNFEKAEYGDGRGIVYGVFGVTHTAQLAWQDVPAYELDRILANGPIRLRSTSSVEPDIAVDPRKGTIQGWPARQ